MLDKLKFFSCLSLYCHSKVLKNEAYNHTIMNLDCISLKATILHYLLR